MTADAIDIRRPPAALAIRPGQEMWTEKQKAALSVLGIRNATNGDLAVFMHYCQKTGLDPFSRQIYMICRREKQGDQWVDKQTIQVGIDGFRVIRDRIEQRQGVTVSYEDTVWYDGDGGEHAVWLWDEAPAAARVVVVKNGRRFPGVVRTASYMQRNKQGDPAGQWRTQPDHMIEKCAEAFALRRAFPQDLGGVWLEDEMPAVPADVARPNGRVTAAEITGEVVPPAPQDPGPAVPDETPARPAAGPGPARPSKAATDKLTKLLQHIPLGDGANEIALIEWLTGHPIDTDLTKADVATVTTFLEDALDNAGGDPELAASRIWEQHKRATGQQEPGDG
jgi:phage recombination protein Bet